MDLAKTLNITRDEDWASMTSATIRKYGGSSLLNQYRDIKETFTTIFPDKDWENILPSPQKKSVIVESTGIIPNEPPKQIRTKKRAPGKDLMLSQVWNDSIDPTGYWISEKFDGCRAYWSGEVLVSRYGKPLGAPDWFIERLPKGIKLDGELWVGYNKFGTLIRLLKTQGDKEWEDCKLMVFDSPDDDKTFEDRIKYLKNNVQENDSLELVPFTLCRNAEHLKEELDIVVKKGGEGLMLRKADASYDVGRSNNMLKVKLQQDAEVKMVKKASKCVGYDTLLPNGVPITIRCVYSDYKNPPPPGTILQVKHFGEWKSGKLKNPYFWRIRTGVTWEEIVEQYNDDHDIQNKE